MMKISSKDENRVLPQCQRRIRSHLLSNFVFVLSAGLIPAINGAVLGMSRRESPNARNIDFVNQSGTRVDLLWINRSTDPVSYHSNSNDEGYPYGVSQRINSFIGHEFEAREMPSKKTGECKTPGKCRTAYFQVNSEEGQKLTMDFDFNIKHEDDRTRAQDEADGFMEECKKKLEEKDLDPVAMIDTLADCMEQKINEALAASTEEQEFQTQLKKRMASDLAPFACGDLSFNTSTEVINRTWTFRDTTKKSDPRRFLLEVFHELASSSIIAVRNFTTPEDCDALRFFVEDDIRIPFSALNDMTKQGQLVQSLAKRFYQLIQATMGWENLAFETQSSEFGVNLLDILTDSEGLSVLPTCTKEDLDKMSENDSAQAPTTCNLPGASSVQVPTRQFLVNDDRQVATVFLFCSQDGNRQLGGLHFPNAAVHLNPQPNMLVIAQHQSIQKPMFDGYTDEYHLCPNHDVMTHTFYFKDFKKTSSDKKRNAETDKDEL